MSSSFIKTPRPRLKLRVSTLVLYFYLFGDVNDKEITLQKVASDRNFLFASVEEVRLGLSFAAVVKV